MGKTLIPRPALCSLKRAASTSYDAFNMLLLLFLLLLLFRGVTGWLAILSMVKCSRQKGSSPAPEPRPSSIRALATTITHSSIQAGSEEVFCHPPLWSHSTTPTPQPPSLPRATALAINRICSRCKRRARLFQKNATRDRGALIRIVLRQHPAAVPKRHFPLMCRQDYTLIMTTIKQ